LPATGLDLQPQTRTQPGASVGPRGAGGGRLAGRPGSGGVRRGPAELGGLLS